MYHVTMFARGQRTRALSSLSYSLICLTLLILIINHHTPNSAVDIFIVTLAVEHFVILSEEINR